MSTAFLLTTLIVVATPGTGVLYTLAAGLSHGVRASIVAAFGCTLGVVPHMLAAITGLAALPSSRSPAGSRSPTADGRLPAPPHEFSEPRGPHGAVAGSLRAPRAARLAPRPLGR